MAIVTCTTFTLRWSKVTKLPRQRWRRRLGMSSLRGNLRLCRLNIRREPNSSGLRLRRLNRRWRYWRRSSGNLVSSLRISPLNVLRLLPTLTLPRKHWWRHLILRQARRRQPSPILPNLTQNILLNHQPLIRRFSIWWLFYVFDVYVSNKIFANLSLQYILRM